MCVRCKEDFVLNYGCIAAESWPDRCDDSNARKDWGWEPEYDLDATVEIMFDLVGKQLAEQKTTGAPKTAASM